VVRTAHDRRLTRLGRCAIFIQRENPADEKRDAREHQRRDPDPGADLAPPPDGVNMVSLDVVH
jgi:hypothetical protein